MPPQSHDATHRPNYADVIARLDALNAVVQNNRDRPDLDEWRREVEKTLLLQTEKLSNVEALIRASLSTEAESQRCPFRDDIRRASNNLTRLGAAETDIKTLKDTLWSFKLEMAKAGAAGGGVVAVVGSAMLFVAKALKWI